MRVALRVLQLQELCPVHDLVLIAGLERIAFEVERFFKVGELLIVEAGGITEWAGSAHPADRRVLIREAALEAHQDVAAAFDVVGDLLQERVVGDVQRRNRR